MPKIKKPEEYDLDEPEKVSGEKSFEEKLAEIAELESHAKEEHRKGGKEAEYWQGRKDGLRLSLAVLEPDNHLWEDLIKSSPGFRVGEREALLNMLERARFNIGAALWEYSEKPDKKIDIRTVVNLLQWISSYDQMAGAGDVTPTPDAITPDWGLLTRGKRTPK